jgi:hypothetical protein
MLVALEVRQLTAQILPAAVSAVPMHPCPRSLALPLRVGPGACCRCWLPCSLAGQRTGAEKKQCQHQAHPRPATCLAQAPFPPLHCCQCMHPGKLKVPPLAATVPGLRLDPSFLQWPCVHSLNPLPPCAAPLPVYPPCLCFL